MSAHVNFRLILKEIHFSDFQKKIAFQVTLWAECFRDFDVLFAHLNIKHQISMYINSNKWFKQVWTHQTLQQKLSNASPQRRSGTDQARSNYGKPAVNRQPGFRRGTRRAERHKTHGSTHRSTNKAANTKNNMKTNPRNTCKQKPTQTTRQASKKATAPMSQQRITRQTNQHQANKQQTNKRTNERMNKQARAHKQTPNKPPNRKSEKAKPQKQTREKLGIHWFFSHVSFNLFLILCSCVSSFISRSFSSNFLNVFICFNHRNDFLWNESCISIFGICWFVYMLCRASFIDYHLHIRFLIFTNHMYHFRRVCVIQTTNQITKCINTVLHNRQGWWRRLWHQYWEPA